MKDRERVGLLNTNQGSEHELGDYKNSNEDSNKKKKKYLIGGGIFVVIVIIAIILGVTLSKKDDGPTPDPGPGPGPQPVPPTPENYNPYEFDESSLLETPNFASGVIRYSNSVKKDNKTNFLSSDLGQSNDEQLEVNTPKILTGKGNSVLKEVRWTLSVNDYKSATFKAEDNLNKRFEAPRSLVKQFDNAEQMRLEMLGISYSKKPFGFSISSTQDSLPLVSTVGKTFYLTEKYLQIDFLLPTQNLFGFGERNHEFQLSQGTWTMWASGQNSSYDNGEGFNQNYGVHPFLLVKARNSTKSGEYFGMFFRNTQGQSPVIKFNDDGTSTLSYITIGGNIEVNFFLKGSAKEIIAQYHNFIGKPALPPFWAFGFHQNSKLFKNTQEMADKVQNFSSQNIPLQSLWLDKQYMQDNTEFTLNQDYKKGLVNLMAALKSQNIKLIPVLGSGFKDSQTSKQVSQAQSANALILNSTSGKPIIGKVDADSVFIDWLNEKSQDIWDTALDGFRKVLSFDGISLDFNENTVNTTYSDMSLDEQCNSKQSTLQDPNLDWYTQCDQGQNSTFYLPFIPSKTKNFDFWSLALNATHPESNFTEYDIHSLNGHMQLKATFQSLINDKLFNKTFAGLRPFAMSRSTFAGSGMYGGHFFGDNDQSFYGLKMYINSILNFNMFGIPFSGGSICGMHNAEKDKPDDVGEICGAWFQVASWVPFAYQNIDELSVNSDITSLPEGPKQAAISSLKERFKYLRHIYTCLFMSGKNGGSCYDPVYFHFPELEIQEYSNTFIVGDAILVQPALELRQNKNTYTSFFPPGKWIQLRTNQTQIGAAGTGSFGPVQFQINNASNAWLREGYIIQQQDNTLVNNTDDLFKTPIGLFANLDSNQHAEGYVFLDNDGSSNLYDDNYELYKIQINGGSIFAFSENENSKGSKMSVNSITIYGELDNKDVDFACYIDKTDRKVTKLNITKDSELSMTLKMNGSDKFDFAMMNVIHFGNSKKKIDLCADTVGAMTGYKWNETVSLETNLAVGTLVGGSNFVQNLTVNFTLLATPSGDTLSVTWNFTNQTLADQRFKFPEEIVNMAKWNLSTSEVTLKQYIIIDDKDPSVLFSVVNPKNKAVVFKLTGLILDNLFNVIESQAMLNKDEQGIIGLGEHVGNSLHLEKGVYSMWSRDVPDPVQTGTLPAANLYGTHPFYMGMDTSSNWFGVFTRLSSAQDWWIDYATDDKQKTTKIKTISTGNSAGEMYFIFADTAPLLVSTYHQNIVGLPVNTPFWALGWNQCRWGYRNDTMLREVYENYTLYNIPLDTLWSDIDYMENYKDFTYDPKNFGGLPQLIDDLHKDHKHYIPIVDAGIAQRPNQNYTPYDEGEKNGYFITYDKDQSTFTGQVWPNDAAFPDFSQNGTRDFWKSQLDAMHDKIPFDGLWLDMNEASNFCNGVCYSNQKVPKPVKNMLPYIPTGRDLEGKSISLDAYHKGNNATELDMHSLFGTWEVATTAEWFTKAGKRPMIIERSGFAGIGKYGSRWMGDNWSDEKYMGYSLVGVQAHNIFGIPLVGSDICGFIGDTTPELCARWHVVGSFYPFSRNHNNFQSPSQEPWIFSQLIYESTTTFTDIMIQAIRNKYRLAKYYYTQLQLVSQNGGSFIQPLFFQFPSDQNSKADLQYNMMIGEALKLGINSDQLDQNFTQIVFPQGATWCNLLYSKEELKSCIIGSPNKQNRSSKAYQFDLHLRDGYIVPLQDSSNVNSTYDLLQSSVELHMNLHCVANDQQLKICSAQGKLINDDGEMLVTDPNFKSVTFDLSLTTDPFKDGEITQKMTLIATKTGDYDCQNNFVNLIYIHNADQLFNDAIYTVTVAGKEINTSIEKESNRLILDLREDNSQDLSKLDGAGIVFTKK